MPKKGLKPAEIERIRKAPKDLLPTLEHRMLLAAHWKDRASTRAQVETAILDHLYVELPESFDEPEIKQLSSRVFGYLMRPGDLQVTH